MIHHERGVDRRRSTAVVTFPLILATGERFESERRNGQDRRQLGSIARQAIFTEIPFSTLEHLAHLWEVRHVDPGQRLLTPGEMNDRLYLLLDGQLEVHIDAPDAETGILIQPGECTGEISIIDGKPATAFVIAAQPSTVLAIPDDRFWSEFMPHPGLARNFMRLFAERFRARNALMQQALEDRLRYEHLEKELAIAAQIQLSMLPHAFDPGDRVDIDARMLPARQVGGDFYDVFNISDDELCIAVGDVSGKGVPASLFMVRVMTMLRTEVQKAQPIEAAIAALNGALSQDNEQCMFVTLAVIVINRRDGGCRYLSGGHNPSVLGVDGRDFGFLSPPGGILIGIEPSAQFEAAHMQLSEGDVLVLYTDGVTEAMDTDGQLFAEPRMLECLNRQAVISSSELSDRLIDAVREHAGEAAQSDDLTLVVVRFRDV